MTENWKSKYQKKIQEEAMFWDERAERLLSLGLIPLWFDHRRGQDVTRIPLDQLRGAGIRADPILYKIVYGNLIDQIIEEATQKRGHALDLGCGAGWLSLELARHGMNVDGYDIGQKQIEIAEKFSRESQESSDPLLHGDFGSTNYRVIDLNQVVLEKEKYKVVVSLGALHHIQHLDHLLGEIHKSLEPNGKFIFYESIGYRGLSRVFPLIFKLVGILPKLARWIIGSTNNTTISAFEGVSQGEIVELVERRFSIQKKEFTFLFLPILVSRLGIYRLPHAFSVPLVKPLYHVDRTLGKLPIFRGPYVFAVARKR